MRVDPSVVSASKFRQAFAEWNEAAGDVCIGDTHWAKQRLLAKGEIADVYLAKRARWPSELVVLKVLRDPGDAPLLENEWRVLSGLDLGVRIPAPVVKSSDACAYRWAGGFLHTFEDVRDAYPHGIPAVASIWIWRRILEVLGVLRERSLVHGAILPQHLLIQNGEHGVRVVGFSCAGRVNDPLRAVCTQFEDFYPDTNKLTATLDVAMSARCIAYLLGDDVPDRLAELLHSAENFDPWDLHKQVGALGKELFGPPAFHPIAMEA